ncbi:MAG: diguanylate cyclase [Pseudomonadota bacterium]
MKPLAHADLVARLQELDRALGDHAKWMARLNRQLICGGPPDPVDLMPDAHLRCAFGAWFHGPAKGSLGAEPGFDAIAVAHESLHGIARHLLDSRQRGETIAPDDYDALMAVSARFRQLLRQLEQRLMERMGAVDKLTGVWNRQAVQLRLAEEVERIQRTRLPCTLCYADLDNFARLNAQLGQQGGDELIQAVAQFFKARLRGYDTLFRIKGEEFLFCMPNTSLEAAATMINRLREELANTSFTVQKQPVTLTSSFGVVALDPVFFIEEILEQAERAQLIAKREGGNGVCVWREGEPEPDPEA